MPFASEAQPRKIYAAASAGEEWARRYIRNAKKEGNLYVRGRGKHRKRKRH